jgi:cytochrome c peroxidase
VYADPELAFSEREFAQILRLSPLPPAPRDPTNRADGVGEAIELGRRLFEDSRLSGAGEHSCKTCHDPARGWTDGRTVAIAAGTGTRNTPSLWNVAQNRWFFWDGRADSLWSQALKPIEHAAELDGSRLQAAHLIDDDAELEALYAAVFGPLPEMSDTERFPRVGGPRAHDERRQAAWRTMAAEDREAVNRVFANAGKAIAAFEATITTRAAPFDRFVSDLRAGITQSKAISPEAQRGLRLFLGPGNCVFCHSGPNFSNKEFHDVRVPLRADASRDTGRLGGVMELYKDEFTAAGPFSDDASSPRAEQIVYLNYEAGLLGHFKTPSLRNVALTPPYMHQGQYASLRDVVRHYSTLEDAVAPADPTHVEVLVRPFSLDEQEIDDLVAFLESLTSEPELSAARAPK